MWYLVTHLKPEVHLNSIKNSVSTSQETVFRYYKDKSVNAVYSEKHMKHTYALCGSSELLNVKGREDTVTTVLCFG